MKNSQPVSPALERIHKCLADAGVGSRRAVEGWIQEGRVKVNGVVATVGQKVGLHDRISVDGRLVARVRTQQPTRVLAYKKRAGEIVTRADPEGRRTVFRKLPKLAAGRWIAVGRLDINTSGLLLMTNDGELARRLTHPSFEIERTYAVRVLGEVGDDLLERLKTGVRLEDGMAQCVAVVRAEPPQDDEEHTANHWLHVTVREGRNRLVRRLFESQELQVSRLIRIAYGPIPLGGGIKSGTARELDPDEVTALGASVGMQLNGRKVPRNLPRNARPRATPGRAAADGEQGTAVFPQRKRPAQQGASARRTSARTAVDDGGKPGLRSRIARPRAGARTDSGMKGRVRSGAGQPAAPHVDGARPKSAGKRRTPKSGRPPRSH
ncbi:MAG: rRNA pseudouridine synthase [Nevskiaceae bacterium]|nr:MAG: rRNA pseudouridine synthase [Nevskiaceae bacterium]TBR74039.1 MAG: rRNA pseudouridine synthase [Nevskiaceae bacterium]